MKKECVAMLLAGGQGSRLYALTRSVAKPAVPFGAKYRIIDFPLSNCVNSGIDTVGVLTQYRPMELNAYLGNGQPWDLDKSDGGVHVLPPYLGAGEKGSWYKGTANAIYQNIDFIDMYDPEYVLILSGDHIYKMDYDAMLDYHKSQGAAATISVLEVSLEEATRFGIMNVDENDVIYEFEEKPKHPKSTLASMGIYIFTWSKLRQALIEDEADPNSKNDFGGNIIPALIAKGETCVAYRFRGYWKDVGTIASLWDANMDLLNINDGIQEFDKSWPIYARTAACPPHVSGPNASVKESLVAGGSEIDGTVNHSVIFENVTIEEGAEVQYSVLMPGAVVKSGARVLYSILAENCVVEENAVVGEANAPIAVVAGGVVVDAGTSVPAGAMYTEESKGGEA